MLSAVISEDGNFSPMNVLNNTDQLALVDATPLDPHALALHAQEAAAEFIAAGTAASTVRSYRGALTYWSAWLQLRYGQVLRHAPLPATVVIQFILDHLARPLADGGLDAPVTAQHRLRIGQGADQSQAGTVNVQYRQSPPSRPGEMAPGQ